MARLLSATLEAADNLQPHLSCSLYSIPFPFRHTGSFWARMRPSNLWEPAACPSSETSVNNSCAHSYTLPKTPNSWFPPPNTHTHTKFHFETGVHLPSAPDSHSHRKSDHPPTPDLARQQSGLNSGSLLGDQKAFSLTFPIACKHGHIRAQISQHHDSGLRPLILWAFGNWKPHEDDSALHVFTVIPPQRRTTSGNKSG